MSYAFAIDQTLDKKKLAANVKEVYNKVYKEYAYYPKESAGCWALVSKLFPWFKEALDVGCGIGQGIAAMRNIYKSVYGCDISDLRNYWKDQRIDKFCKIAPAHKLPYTTNRFDLVVCSDVLEHIPEKLVDDTLAELYRVGRGCYYLTICSRQDKAKNNLRERGIVELHITIKPDDWWEEKIKAHGMDIISKTNYEEDPGLVTFIAVKNIFAHLFEPQKINVTGIGGGGTCKRLR
jgi:ubiquinone/menaquinone biosynthesis C-methylase UbiE